MQPSMIGPSAAPLVLSFSFKVNLIQEVNSMKRQKNKSRNSPSV